MMPVAEITHQESVYRGQKYKVFEAVKEQDLFCCSCENTISFGAANYYSHPFLKILQCQACYDRFRHLKSSLKVEAWKERCLICGYDLRQVLFPCVATDCPYSLCKNCIERNSTDLLEVVVNPRCFVCRTHHLWKSRGVCAALMSSSSRRRKQQRMVCVSSSEDEIVDDIISQQASPKRSRLSKELTPTSSSNVRNNDSRASQCASKSSVRPTPPRSKSKKPSTQKKTSERSSVDRRTTPEPSESWICTQLDVNQVTCEWTVTSSQLLSRRTGGALYSPLFYTGYGKQQWKLALFPHGEHKTCANFVSLFLRLESSEKLGIEAKFKIIISNLNKMMVDESFTHEFDELGGFGEPELIELSKLLSPDCSEIKITIHCSTDTGISIKEKKLTSSHLGENMRLLLEDSTFSDVTIIVGDTKLAAHKSILAVRSSVFAAMLHNKEIKENHKDTVEIKDTEPAVVRAMLEYIYTGQIVDFDALVNGLLVAAKNYNLTVLRAACEETLCETLDVNNAAEILTLANLHDASKLKQSALKFIKNNVYAVAQTDGYKKINDLTLLKEIISFGEQEK